MTLKERLSNSFSSISEAIIGTFIMEQVYGTDFQEV